MTCDLCKFQIDGYTFGPTVRDTWCMPCWFEHSSNASEVKQACQDACGRADLNAVTEDLDATLRALDEREEDLESDLEDAEDELDEARSKVEGIEKRLRELRTAREMLEKLKRKKVVTVC